MIVGYARCRIKGQSLNWQLDSLSKNGCERIYQETMTRTQKNRPELARLLDSLRPHDIVVVCELTILSQSVKDLFELVDSIHERGADIKSLKETWLDTTTSTGKSLFTMIAGVRQFERDLIVERTKQGLAAARARGKLGGRPKADPSAIKNAIALYLSGNIPIQEIVEMTGVARSTLYKYLKLQKIKVTRE